MVKNVLNLLIVTVEKSGLPCGFPSPRAASSLPAGAAPPQHPGRGIAAVPGGCGTHGQDTGQGAAAPAAPAQRRVQPFPGGSCWVFLLREESGAGEPAVPVAEGAVEGAAGPVSAEGTGCSPGRLTPHRPVTSVHHPPPQA